MARKDRKAGQTPAPPEPEPVSATETDQEQQPAGGKRKQRTVACAGCGGVFALALIITIFQVRAWDARDSRLYDGTPLPENVAYIGRWISNDALSVRIDTFAVAGDRIACDFALRNDSDREVTVQAIGRTIIAPSLEARFNLSRLGLEIMDGDLPMHVTDEENVMGLQQAMGGVWLIIEPDEGAATPPAPFTLKPGDVERFRYRPYSHEMLMPASTLRLAVLLDDGNPPRPFYFLRQSAGLAGLFERGAEKALSGAQ